MNEITADNVSNASSYDKAILRGLEKAPKTPLRRLHFHSFFKHGLNRTMLYMIHSRKDSVRELINKLPALFVDNFRANENVVVELLTYFKTEITHTFQLQPYSSVNHSQIFD